jgi:hypothetical protein
MRYILIVAVLALGLPVAAAARGAEGGGLQNLPVLAGGYPRAFFFRACESMAANPRVSYDEWDRTFSRLMGIEGKALDEELPNRSARNIEFFTRFKARHPDQLVMLHYNGNARDPRYQAEKFFAGHWLYFNGAKVLADVPAAEGETDIQVEDARLFHVNMGRYSNAAEDVGLCLLDEAGRPDAARRVIRVKRGCYGTKPRAFPAGRAYAAAHATEGPWGKASHLLWFYNYSTRCPRDAAGRTCGEVHADELAARLMPGGELAAFDGLEFDVLSHDRGPGGRARGLDCDADGRIDNGAFDGLNTYGIGVVEFCRRLRRTLGERRLILADGMGARNQRAFGILNGIESEGWPTLSDWEARDWSGGLNRQAFWAENGRPPVFNYINHKFVMRGDEPGVQKAPDVPWSIHRLVFAAAVMTDSAVCYSFAPPKEEGEGLGIWDELAMGTAGRPGWLGRPLGKAVRPALAQPDLLAGQAAPVAGDLLARLGGDGVSFAVDAGALKVTAADPGARELRFRLRGVPADGPDLFVSVAARGDPMAGYPREVARLAWVGVGPGDKAERYMTWVGAADFTSGFYFRNVQAKTVDVEFSVEGSAPIWISRLTAHAHADAMYRVFENGVVLANPSLRPYAFRLSELAPGRKFRRLQGSSRQDPRTNDGSAAPDSITIPPRDALFLAGAPR